MIPRRLSITDRQAVAWPRWRLRLFFGLARLWSLYQLRIRHRTVTSVRAVDRMISYWWA